MSSGIASDANGLRARALALVVFLCITNAAAQAPPPAPELDDARMYRVHKPPPQESVKISLFADKMEFFLGENILLHYCIENLSQDPVQFSTGFDYRGGTRAKRFKVSAVNAAGCEMPDPAPAQMNMGGMGGGGPLEAGDKWFESVWLLRYRNLDQPGDYTVTVFHDLGWGPRCTNDSRVVSLKLRLKEPTEAEARQVIADMEKARSYSGNSWGKKGQPTADFSLLKYPVYLRLLQKNIEKESVEGLARMETLDATRVLLRLMKSPRSDVASSAACALSVRIPVSDKRKPTKQVLLPFRLRGGLGSFTNAWEVSLGPEAQRAATVLLERSDDNGLVGAAAVLAGVGTADDLPALFAALNRAAERAQTAPVTFKDHHEGPRWACRDSTSILEQLARADLPMPKEPRDAAEYLAFVAAFAAREDFRPPGWEKTFAKALEHERGVVREAALRRLPKPLPETLSPLVLARMADSESAVNRVACEMANNLKLSGGREQALKAIASTDDGWTLMMAVAVAVRDNGRVECAELLARRFAELADHPQYFSMEVMRHLVEITLGGFMSGNWHFLRNPGGKARAEQLRDEWLKVIHHHAEDLRAGRRLIMGQGVVTTNLVPPGVEYTPPDAKPKPPDTTALRRTGERLPLDSLKSAHWKTLITSRNLKTNEKGKREEKDESWYKKPRLFLTIEEIKDEGFLWKIFRFQKAGVHYSYSGRGNIGHASERDFLSSALITSTHYKFEYRKVGSEIVSGKPCDIYESQDNLGSAKKQKIWLWTKNDFLMKSVFQDGEKEHTRLVTEVEVDIDLPDSLFQPPANINFRDARAKPEGRNKDKPAQKPVEKP